MKKISLLLFFALSFMSSNVYAVLSCQEKDLSMYLENPRYLMSGQSSVGDTYLLVKDSIKKNTKNKTAEAWIIHLASKEVLGQINPNLDGYAKVKVVFDLKNNRFKMPQTIFYTCNHTVYDNHSEKGEWMDVVPGSMYETVLKNIQKF